MKKINLIALVLIVAGIFFAACSKKDLPEATTPDETEDSIPPVSPPPTKPVVDSPAVDSNDVVGKVTVGYQGWFSAKGDGSPMNSWAHQNLEMWPDVREYTTTYSGYPFNQKGKQVPPFTGNLGNGQPARMFSSDDQQVADTHCLWMKQSEIDCIALQRFGSYTTPGAVKNFHDAVDVKMMKAAEKYGLKFYMMYDCNATSPVTNDWTNTIVNMQHLTSSPSYAKQDGKVVVCLYGIGLSGRGETRDWVTMINWFKAQGCYVIGAVTWGFSTRDYLDAVNACDMIMPWAVGRTSTTNFATAYGTDKSYCDSKGIDYQADVYPGTAFYNSDSTWVKNKIPRMHGDLMWQQFAGAKIAGVKSIYISMFDELNEATQIMKAAEDTSMIPAGTYFVTMDADGEHLSSDFYLRLVKDGGRMIKGSIPFTSKVPTPFVL